MDQGVGDLLRLAEAAIGQPAFVRAALEEREGWTLRTCHAVVGKEPPGWSSAVWDYEAATLVAWEMDAEAFVALFAAEGSNIDLVSRSVRIPPAGDNLNFYRLPSHGLHDMAPLPWPSTDYTIFPKAPGVAQGGSQGFLIGDGDTPSFTDFQTAVHAFFYNRWSNIGARTIPQELARVRMLNAPAWLEQVRVTPTKVRVRVGGENYLGSRVELSGDTVRDWKRVGTTGIVTLNLPGGLPNDAWLYLTRNKRWIDYRALGSRLGSLSGPGAVSGVTVEVPDDLDTRIQALRFAGEGPDLEFKRALPTTADAKRKVFKTVAAFANSVGGTVVFGIDPDELTLTGIEEAAEPRIRDQVGDLIRAIVVPTPEFNVRVATVDGKGLLVLTVSGGSSKPYGLRFGDKPVEFYVRRGASTYPATQAEVRSAALSTASLASVTTPWRVE